MADRLTIDEFFNALKAQGKEPYIDTPDVRAKVLSNVRSLTSHYPIQDRWPVLDLESAYEIYLNNRPDLAKLVRMYCYLGVINLSGFDEAYSMDEWFGDFTTQYHLTDSSTVRERMLRHLPPGNKWNASQLYKAYEAATRFTVTDWIKGLLRWQV